MGGGSPQSNQGSVLLGRCGGIPTEICWVFFFGIVVVTTVVLCAAFSAFRYLTIRSPINRGGFYLICARPCETSVFNTVFVIGNIFIVIDISAIISL